MAVSLVQADPRSRAHAHHLLVCLDRSRNSEVTLPYVYGMAKTFGSSVTFVYVMEQPRQTHAGMQMSDVLDWEISRREADVFLERIKTETELELGQPVQVRLEQGNAAERIVDVAREIGADLIVVSSHGEGGASGANLGSTVQKLLTLARTSVFVVHTSRPAGRELPRRLLVPLDGSSRTESILPTAVRIAEAFGAELLLVHVVQEPMPTLVLHAPQDIALARELASHLELAGTRYLRRLRDRLVKQNMAVQTLVVRHVNERQALLEVSRNENADLIVLSAHGSACDPVHSFGSVTTDLLIHSDLPTLVLQDLPDDEWRSGAHLPHISAPPLRASYPPEGE